MRIASFVLITVLSTAAFASAPGQPIDCSDWVSDIPGFTCEESPVHDTKGTNLAIDNQGFKLYLDFLDGHFKLVRVDPSTGQRQVVGHIEGRETDRISAVQPCPSTTASAFSCNDHVVQENVVFFDPVGGTLSIPVISQCAGAGCVPPENLPYPVTPHTFRIRGFATLFEIFQGYVPPSATIGFTVPWMPEGMPAADHFDTYWGPLSKPIDFTQAHSLACAYPSTPPHVGDYVSVADTVPTPSPGQGIYYLTAATYQGATRYGRKTAAGQLSGRDPALLPACMLP